MPWQPEINALQKPSYLHEASYSSSYMQVYISICILIYLCICKYVYVSMNKSVHKRMRHIHICMYMCTYCIWTRERQRFGKALGLRGKLSASFGVGVNTIMSTASILRLWDGRWGRNRDVGPDSAGPCWWYLSLALQLLWAKNT